MSDTATFDPRRHIRDLKGSDYLDVKWRLVWLRSEHPDAAISTDAYSITDQIAIFRATVTLPNGGYATGYGSEQPKDFRDYIEKAETKAIGRALSALGYGTQFASDHEDGSSSGSPVDAPIQRQATAPTEAPAAPDESPDDKKKRALAAVFAVASDKHLIQDDVKLIAYQRYQVESMTALTIDQLREYWRYLNDSDEEDLLEAARVEHVKAEQAAKPPDKARAKKLAPDDGDALFNQVP